MGSTDLRESLKVFSVVADTRGVDEQIKKATVDTQPVAALIVDDSDAYAGILRRILTTTLGVEEVTHCASLAAAEELLRNQPGKFSLLFVDYRFPTGGSGVELLERVQEVLPESTVPFLITSEPTPDNVKRAMAAGARAVVAKPFDRTQLTLQVTRVLKRGLAEN